MIHRLKTLSFLGLTVLALGVVFASSAGADSFTSSEYPTSVTASGAKGNDVINTEGGKVECASHFSGTLAKASTSVTLTASYTECQAFGFASATVIMGCDYVFHVTGAVDIECPASNKIVITAGSCEVQIGTQTGLSKVELSNGSGDISAKVNLSGIKYNVTKDGSGCPFGGTGEKTGGTYAQSSAVTVSSTDGASLDIGTTPSGAGTYTAAGYPTTATATSAFGNDTLITEAGAVQCAAHFAATLVEPSSHLTVTPTYTGGPGREHCAFASFNLAITMNGCSYTFETPPGSGANWNAPMQIACPAGQSILVRIPATGSSLCEFTVGAQTPGGSVALVNTGGDVTAQANVTGINYTVTKDGFGCPFAGTGAKTGAAYTQHNPITLDAPVDISVSG